MASKKLETLKKVAEKLDNPVVLWAAVTLLVLGGQYKLAEWIKTKDLPLKF